MRTIQSTTRWLGLALAGGIITFAALAQAGKPVKPPKPPPGPPVDTGVIYAQIAGDVYAISPDGSGQQYLFRPPAQVDVPRVVASRLTHSGERWFVGWQGVDGTYPDGVSGRYRLIAMSESGAVVPLHNDVMLQPSQGSYSSLRWMPGDGSVSWLAMRWDGDTVVEWGIYTLDLEFTADGSIATGSPTLLDWTAGLFELWYEEPPSPWLEGYYLLVNDYDWSPDGSAIAYSASDSEEFSQQLYVADNTGGVAQLTDEDTSPAEPRWSPDGTRIVFKLNHQHQIDVIDLVGAERYTLITTARSDYTEQVFRPGWSPGSSHVVYCHYTYRQGKGARDALRVIAVDGSGDTQLTGDYTFVDPLGWCTEE